MVTIDEIDEVLLYLSRMSPAMKIVPGMSFAWHEALDDQTAADVWTAAKYLAKRQTFVGVADIRGMCKRLRSDRLKAAGNIYALVQADPEDTHAYQAEYQRLHAEIAAGAALPPRLEVL